jgi:hypothetical protein
MQPTHDATDLLPAVASWRDQIERLSEHVSPCRYLLPAKWKAMRGPATAAFRVQVAAVF